MRRSIAIALTLLFGWLLLVPAFASSGESGVPACCRRNGKHHCMTGMSKGNPGEAVVASVNSKCPCFPQATVVPHVPFSEPEISQEIYAGLVSHPALSPQTEAGYRVSHLRSREKRGPPVLFLS